MAAPAGRQRRPSHAAKTAAAAPDAAGAASALPAGRSRVPPAGTGRAPRPRPPPPPPPGSPSLSSLSSDDEAVPAAAAPLVRCSALANPSAHHSVPAYRRSRFGGALPRPVPSLRVATATGSAMPSRRVPSPVPGVQPSWVRRRAPRPETGGGGGGGGGGRRGRPIVEFVGRRGKGWSQWDEDVSETDSACLQRDQVNGLCSSDEAPTVSSTQVHETCNQIDHHGVGTQTLSFGSNNSEAYFVHSLMHKTFVLI